MRCFRIAISCRSCFAGSLADQGFRFGFTLHLLRSKLRVLLVHTVFIQIKPLTSNIELSFLAYRISLVLLEPRHVTIE